MSMFRADLFKRIVQLSLGGLLLTAAGLKLYGQSVSAVPSVGWFATPSVQLATVLWEIGLGLSLLVGSGRAVVWLLSVSTFAIFAGVSGYLGLQGVANCGCFGVIKATESQVVRCAVSGPAFLEMGDRIGPRVPAIVSGRT